MSLKSSFKTVYAELLSKYGYVYCPKLDCFTKLVNQKFIHLIGLNSKRYIAYTSGYKAFSITGTIVSIYYPYLEKTHLNVIARHLDSYSHTEVAVRGFEYNKNSIEDALMKSFTYAEKSMLPIMEKVVDYDSYINYQIRINNEMLSFANQFKFDSLVLIVTDNHDDFMTVVDENYSMQPEEAKSQLLYDSMCQVITDYITKPRDEVFQNTELLSKALIEAKHRKEQNLTKLRLYKVIEVNSSNNVKI